MPEFQNKEEYEKWKAERIKGNHLPENVAASPKSNIKNIVVLVLFGLIVGVVLTIAVIRFFAPSETSSTNPSLQKTPEAQQPSASQTQGVEQISHLSSEEKQSVLEAVHALQKLQTRCQVGMSYRDYSPALADAKYAVTIFINSPAAKRNAQLTEAINNAITHYEFAKTVWDREFNGVLKGFISGTSPLGQSISSTYPSAASDIGSGGAMYNERNLFVVESLLPIIWHTASDETMKAVNLSQ